MEAPQQKDQKGSAVDDYGLTPDERREFDRHVRGIKSAHRGTIAAVVRLGTLLLALRTFQLGKPRHERVRTWEQVCAEDLEIEVSSAYDYMDVALVDAALKGAGLDPLPAISQALAVAADGGRGDAALIVERVRVGRALAEAEGVRPAARHFEAARNRSTVPSDDKIRAALAELGALDRGGDDAAPDGLRVMTVDHGRRRVVPWADEVPEDWPGGVDRAGVAPVRLDPVADLVWSVMVRDLHAVPTAWDVPGGPFRATYVPARLGSTTLRSKATSSRSRVVLAAPDIDVFDDEVPDRAVAEIAGAVAADPTRLYLFMTRNVGRAATTGLPPNAVAVLVARTADEAVALAAEVRGTATNEGGPAWALVLRDLLDAPEEGYGEALDAFDWVLVRGAATTWEALAAVYEVVSGDRIHVGKEVRARPEASPLLARLPTPAERPDRAAVPVKLTRRPGGPALPAC